MKKIISVFLIISFAVLTVTVHAQIKDERKGIAVLDFKPSGVSASDSSFVTDFFRNALVSEKAFRLIDKSNMDRILAEQGFQQTGCTTQECAVQMGKMLNVQGMISGTFGLFFGEYMITINLVEVETGEIIYSDTGKRKDPSLLEVLTKEMARRLVADQTGKAAPVKKAPPVVYEEPPAEEPPAPTAPPMDLPPHIHTGFDGTITRVQGNQVTVNMGKLHGISKGQALKIIAIVEKIKSPITGQITGIKTKVIGKMKITYVEPQHSMGTIVSLKTGYKVEAGQGIKLAEAKTFRLGVEGLWSFPSDSGSGYNADALQESEMYLDWKFSVLRVNAGIISNNFFTATTAGRLPLGYILLSLDFTGFGIGIGSEIGDSGLCFGIRFGPLEGNFNVKENIYVNFYNYNNDYNGYADESILPDMHLVNRLEMNIKSSNKLRIYSLFNIDMGAKNYDSVDYYVPNLGTVTLQNMMEARLAFTFGMKLKANDRLTFNVAIGYYEYIYLESYTYNDGTEDIISDIPSDFQTINMIGGMEFNITDKFLIGAGFIMESGASGESREMEPQIRLKTEFSF